MNQLELKYREIAAEMREKQTRDGAHGHLYEDIKWLLRYIQWLQLRISASKHEQS